MKLTISIFIITLFTIACSTKNQVKPLKPIHVATGNWRPYVGAGLAQNGPVAEMITAILIELDYIPEFKFYNWGFVHTHLDAGYPSFAFPYIKGNDTTKYKYSDPIVQIEYVLYYYSDSGKISYNYNSLQQLIDSKKQIGKIRGYTNFPGINNESMYVEVPNAADGFNKLITGDIDFLIEAKQVGQLLTMSSEIPVDATCFKYIGQANLPDNANDTVFVKNLPFRIKFSPKISNDFVERINLAIKTCSKTDYFKSLVSKLQDNHQDYSHAYLMHPDRTMIYGYTDSIEKQPTYILSSSTHVIIIYWNEIFRNPIQQKKLEHAKLRSQVKILNGPLQGKVVWVENDNIELLKK